MTLRSFFSLHLLSVISIEVEGIEMNGSLNVNNYISGRLYSVEICLVIVQDCVQYLHSLKRKYFSIKEKGERQLIINAHHFPRLH